MTGLCRHDLFFSTLKIIFNRAGISLEPITAQPVYQPMPDSTVRLAWQVEIYALDGQNWWSTRVDASNRTVLDEFDYVIHDDFGAHGEGGAAVAATDLTHLGETPVTAK